MTETETRPELAIYLRASTPRPAREQQWEVIEQAERLAAEGRVADMTIRHWDDRVTVFDDSSEHTDTRTTEALEAFEAFKSRAEEVDHVIEPFFQEHERAGEREIVFPVICIAVYANEKLRRVFPCIDEGGINSVWDCLAALEIDGEVAGLTD